MCIVGAKGWVVLPCLADTHTHTHIRGGSHGCDSVFAVRGILIQKLRRTTDGMLFPESTQRGASGELVEEEVGYVLSRG